MGKRRALEGELEVLEPDIFHPVEVGFISVKLPRQETAALLLLYCQNAFADLV